MVMIDIEAKLDVANGARGIVKRIILDPWEDANMAQREVPLRYPPACVLVRLNQTTVPKLLNLDQGIVLIIPFEQKFYIPQHGKTKSTAATQ